jgi:uncharacterized protein YodC (DUF2158 family)
MKVGDVVRLASGGPTMTVKSMPAADDSPVEVQYWNPAASAFEEARFPASLLTLVTDEVYPDQNRAAVADAARKGFGGK